MPLRSSRACIVAGFWAMFACAPSFAVEVKDATGTNVVVRDHPARIVTLVPSLGELVADLLPDHASRIVGVSDYTDYPTSLAKIPTVGSYAKFNIERVMMLKPDLVLATLDGNAKDQVNHLRELGLPVVVVATSGFDQVADSVRLLGRAIGNPSGASDLASRLSKGIAEARERGSRRTSKLSVLLQLGDDPLVTAGSGTFLDEALRTIGARNLYGDSKISYPKPSLEDVLARKPSAVIILAMTGDPVPFEKMAKKWRTYRELPAVKDNRIRIIKADTVTRPTIRLLEGLRLLEEALYGS